MKRILLALLIIISTAGFSLADTIVLRDGRKIQGTLLGFVNGRFVVRIEPRNATNQNSNPEYNTARGRRNEDIQYFRPEEIDRIEIDGRSLADTRFETHNVDVALESNWVDSGVYVRRGERVQVSASGVITVGRARITPDGLRTTDRTAPLPNAAEGELIGALGNDPRSPVIELGSNKEFTAERNGRLYLTANRGSYTDARGSFAVEIRRERSTNSANDEMDRGGEIRTRDRGSNLGQPADNRSSDSQRERTIEVQGNNSRGVDTNIDLRAGDPITISATGTIFAGRRVGETGPDGKASSGFGSIVNARPLPSAGVGALIGYIRMADGRLSTPYVIGSNLTTTVPTDGRLILAVNDDDYSDNTGSFSVRIRY